MAKIMYLSGYFYPEISFPPFMYELFEEITSLGIEIDVLCPLPSRGVSTKIRKDYKHRFNEEMFQGKVHVKRFWAPAEGKNLLLRTVRYLWCNFRQACLVKKYDDIDMVLAYSAPPTQGFISGFAKKKLHCPFVYYLQDIFPDSLRNMEIVKEDTWLYKLGRKIEEKTYEMADTIVVISEDFKNNLIQKGVNSEKIALIYNWINENQVVAVPREDNRIFKKYQIPEEKFYVAYSGTLGHSQNLDLLVDVAKYLQGETDIGFLVVGDGAMRPHLEKRIAEEKLENVVLMPFQPYELISDVCSLGDVGLIISKSGIGVNSVPSKTWSYFSAKRPVIASFDLNTELSNLIQSNQCGICVAPDNTEELARAILTMKANREQCVEMGENAREYILNNLTKNQAMKKWRSVIAQYIR